MNKLVSAFQTDNKILTQRFPQIRVDLLLRRPENDESIVISALFPRQAELLQGFLVSAGQAVQLPNHQVHHIVGVTFGVDAIEVPKPSPIAMIESEQSLFGQRMK